MVRKRIRIVYFALILFFSGCVSRVQCPEYLRWHNAEKDLEYIEKAIFMPEHPLNLDEIIAIALKRNLDLQVKEYEYAMQDEASFREKMKMLPQSPTDAEVSWRNKNTGSSSKSLVPNIPPAPPSISSEQNVHRYQVNFTWNLIDFGVSYFRAKQEANKALLKQIEYRRLQQNLILSVVEQYWKAVVAKRAFTGAKAIVVKAQALEKTYLEEAKKRYLSEENALKARFQLLNIQIAAKEYQKDYYNAKMHLALQMGLPPWVEFEIHAPDSLPEDLQVEYNLDMEELAMLNRPELIGLDVEETIPIDDIKAAVLQFFPQPIAFLAPSYDGNHFLIFNNWLVSGLRVAWNLLAIPYHYEEAKVAEWQRYVTQHKRFALALGVLIQVNLTKLILNEDIDQYLLTQRLNIVKRRLLEVASKQMQFGEISEAERIIMAYDAHLAEVSAWKAYGDYELKLEELNNTIGIPRLFATNDQGIAQPRDCP